MQDIDQPYELACPEHPVYHLTTSELLIRAKDAINAGEASIRDAVEDMALAQMRGESQRHIAKSVGKSAAWVNKMLKWRETGYRDETAFGPQTRASRQRVGRVRAAKHGEGGAATRKAQTPALAPERVRDRLIKALGMLGSKHEGERANAASAVESMRRSLGRGWDELIVPIPHANGN